MQIQFNFLVHLVCVHFNTLVIVCLYFLVVFFFVFCCLSVALPPVLGDFDAASIEISPSLDTQWQDLEMKVNGLADKKKRDWMIEHQELFEKSVALLHEIMDGPGQEKVIQGCLKFSFKTVIDCCATIMQEPLDAKDWLPLSPLIGAILAVAKNIAQQINLLFKQAKFMTTALKTTWWKKEQGDTARMLFEWSWTSFLLTVCKMHDCFGKCHFAKHRQTLGEECKAALGSFPSADDEFFDMMTNWMYSTYPQMFGKFYLLL